ncbi:MAG: amidohydrolase family protein [Phycisphaerales bacterium]|nr:amidohydrolase family protein [Phycisphaerales bacterium]MCB9864417.1 amidohydrolase family protein [Phycisphaerales bacterium]
MRLTREVMGSLGRRVLLFAVSGAIALSAGLRFAAADDRYVVIKTKKAITVSGKEIDDATIVIVGGKIEAVGKKVDYPSDSRVIDASKLTAMPGMINPRSSLGLKMQARRGNASNNLVRDAFEPPDDKTYEELLEAGYTLLGLVPNGQGLPGQALVISTHEPKANEGVRDEGLVRITMQNPARDKKVLRDALKAAEEEIKKEKEAASKPATQTAEGGAGKEKGEKSTSQPTSQPASQPAKEEKKKDDKPKEPEKPKIKPELEALVKLLKKEKDVLAQVEFRQASDVLHFADVIDGKEFARVYAFAGTSFDDYYNIIDHELIGGADATVLMRPVLPNMPLTVNPYNLAQELSTAGCSVAFMPVADNVKNHEQIRERAALLIRAGLKRETALKALTLNAAKYLGMEKDYGSIDKDKKADIVLFDGDPLDPFAKVKMVIVGGEVVFDAKKKGHR